MKGSITSYAPTSYTKYEYVIHLELFSIHILIPSSHF